MPVKAPANSAKTSSSRSRTTRPTPSALATTRWPASSPAARSASTGMVTWFLVLIRVLPLRRFFTSLIEVRVLQKVRAEIYIGDRADELGVVELVVGAGAAEELGVGSLLD